jgi:hypothetical protein
VKPEERAFVATDGLSAHDLGYGIWPVIPFKKVPAITNWPRLACARPTARKFGNAARRQWQANDLNDGL